jgi:hypothetical protein
VVFSDVHGVLDCVVVLNMLVDHDVAATMTRCSSGSKVNKHGPALCQVLELVMHHFLCR